MLLLEEVVHSIMRKRHQSLLVHGQEPLLTIIFSHEGGRDILLDSPGCLSTDREIKTIAGCMWTVDREQKELFRIVER